MRNLRKIGLTDIERYKDIENKNTRSHRMTQEQAKVFVQEIIDSYSNEIDDKAYAIVDKYNRLVGILYVYIVDDTSFQLKAVLDKENKKEIYQKRALKDLIQMYDSKPNIYVENKDNTTISLIRQRKFKRILKFETEVIFQTN